METSEREQWRRIADYPHYFISNRGRFRHHRKILKGSYSIITGHHVAVISNGGEIVGKYIARLVLEAFVGPAPKGMFVRFRDGNKHNLHLSNLEWAPRAGRRPAPVSEEDIEKVVKLYEQGKSRKEIAELLDTNYAAVTYRLRRRGLVP